jgi:hypothetical protein
MNCAVVITRTTYWPTLLPSTSRWPRRESAHSDEDSSLKTVAQNNSILIGTLSKILSKDRSDETAWLISEDDTIDYQLKSGFDIRFDQIENESQRMCF